MNREGWKQRAFPRRGERRASAGLDAVGAAVMRRCPVTGGNPTVMSAESFDRLCSAAWKRAEGDPGMLTGFCLECRAKSKPPELTIVDLCSGKQVEGIMPSDSKKGTCAACGREGSVVSHFGVWVCPSCQVVRIGCKNRPDVVVEQLRKLAPGTLDAAAPVQVADESSLLASLREILQAGDGDIVLAARKMEAVFYQAEKLMMELGVDEDIPLSEYVVSLIDDQEERFRKQQYRAQQFGLKCEELEKEVRELKSRLESPAVNFLEPVVEERVGPCLCGRDEVLLDLLIEALGEGQINLGAAQIKALRG